MLRIVIADSDETSRNLISRVVSQISGVRVVATVDREESLVRAVTYRRPDVVFVSTDLGGARGYQTAETLIRQTPKLHVAMLSPRGNDADEILRGMKIGARDCLALPLTEDAVLRVLQDATRDRDVKALRPGTIIPILSSRGGVGKSTIAVNLAIAFRRRYAARVALVDGDLHFGDVAILLNIKAKRTIHELHKALHPEIAAEFLHKHSSGIEVLAAPRREREAAKISPNRFREILCVLQNLYDLIIVDGVTADAMPGTLDVASLAIVVSTLDVFCLEDVHKLVELLHRLPVPLDNLVPVGNRFDDRLSFAREDAERFLGAQFATLLPRDDRNVVAGNRGTPLILSNPSAPFVRQIAALASTVAEYSGSVYGAGAIV